MGWFGFGGSRSRDERPRADARFQSNGADARLLGNGADARLLGNGADARFGDYSTEARFVHQAVRIDRAGKPSRLLDARPRRRDFADRWDRRG
jgi:hypothetical protein